MNNQINKVIELLKESKLTLSSCESLTGGLFASIITSFSGVSSFFKGALVTYQNEVKEIKASNAANKEELLLEANKWELSHGGLSGRTAQQFIDYLLGQM